MLDRLRARKEWWFFGVLLKADGILAIAWWAAPRKLDLAQHNLTASAAIIHAGFFLSHQSFNVGTPLDSAATLAAAPVARRRRRRRRGRRRR